MVPKNTLSLFSELEIRYFKDLIMLQKIVLGALAVLPLGVMAQQDFTVAGKVGSLNSPAKAYLVYADNGARKIDSAEIVNGAFSFQGSVAQATMANLAIDHEGVGIQQLRSPDLVNIFLEKGTVQIQSADSLSNAAVSGTALNDDQQKLMASIKPIIEKQKSVVAQYQGATEEQRNTPEFTANLESQFESLGQQVQDKQIDFIKSNPQSMLSLYSLQDIAGSSDDITEVETLFNNLSAEVKASELGKSLQAQLETSKAVAIGAIAPDFTQADTAGNPVSLKDFRGKYVLLDFWASWCGPCRAENPNVVEAYQKFKDKNFTVLGISLDREGAKDAWMKAIHDDNLTWTQVSDLKFWENAVARQYGIRSIPQNFLLDPQGKIIATNLRGEELHKKLEEVL